MQAILLVAGVGRRLRPFTETQPKCLLRFGGRTLLARSLETLESCGVASATLVVGHLNELIRAEVSALAPRMRLQFLYNPDYERGNIGSLMLARDVLRQGPTLVMDGDVLCDRSIFGLILNSPFANAILVDRRLTDTGEEMKVVASGDRVCELSKHINGPGLLAGESLGIYKFSAAAGALLADQLQQSAAQVSPDAEYEIAIQQVLGRISMTFIDVAGRNWIEIDTPADLSVAQDTIFPRLDSSEGDD